MSSAPPEGAARVDAVSDGAARRPAAALWPGLVAVAAITAAAALLLWAETEVEVASLIVVAALGSIGAARVGAMRPVGASFADHERTLNIAVVLGVVVLAALFYEEHFPLLMIATTLLYLTACLGLNIQFGFTGMVNFAGAAFFGVGCYAAAVLTKNTGLPHLLIVLIGGVMAALIGSILILPVLRTRGHYSAVVTIAFSLLFKTFLEVNDTLGGPQGLKVDGLNIFGWDFNSDIEIGENIEISFYVNYVIFSLLLAMLAFGLTRRLERSWIGLNLDTIRLDETASACFGLRIERWKITAFTLGNFLAGLAGAVYGMMLGFIAPTNFTFADSLILVSIVLLGGMGSVWGTALAAAIIIILPEKFQAIQEYRFLLFAVLIILMLLFRPNGLIARGARAYIPGWRPR